MIKLSTFILAMRMLPTAIMENDGKIDKRINLINALRKNNADRLDIKKTIKNNAVLEKIILKNLKNV